MKPTHLFFLLLCVISCAQESASFQNEYPQRYIGDIEFDPKLDNPAFHLCKPDYVYQYFNNSGGIEYGGEKIAIDKIFEKNYNSKIAKKESGLIRIRFIVNCEGKTDRFRVLGADENYQEKEFDKSITDQLLTITKSLDGWKVKYYNDSIMDYYQYLIFKMKDGKILKILP